MALASIRGVEAGGRLAGCGMGADTEKHTIISCLAAISAAGISSQVPVFAFSLFAVFAHGHWLLVPYDVYVKVR